MKIVFAADLHSNESHYAALSVLISDIRPDAVILGGDLFAASRDMDQQLVFAEDVFRSFLGSIVCKVFWIPGNTDLPPAVEFVDRLSDEKSEMARLLPVSCSKYGPLNLLGYPYVPPSPFRFKYWERRDLKTDNPTLPDPSFTTTTGGKFQRVSNGFFQSTPSIEEDMDGLAVAAQIWVMHGPPHGGFLDVVSGGNIAGASGEFHAGSVAVRRAIEKAHPVLSLHGHIHEAPTVSGEWIERIGNTIAVNPGRGERLHAVVVDIGADCKILRLAHTVFGDADPSPPAQAS